jgi:hypothetical protein
MSPQRSVFKIRAVASFSFGNSGTIFPFFWRATRILGGIGATGVPEVISVEVRLWTGWQNGGWQAGAGMMVMEGIDVMFAMLGMWMGLCGRAWIVEKRRMRGKKGMSARKSILMICLVWIRVSFWSCGVEKVKLLVL